MSYYKGINNPGSLCYMISIVQQLFMIPCLRQTLIDEDLNSYYNDNCNNIMEKEFSVITELIHLMHLLNNNSKYDKYVVVQGTNLEKVRFLLNLKYFPYLHI